MDKTFDIDDGNCTAGCPPKPIDTAQIDDIIRLHTRDGRSFDCKIIDTDGEYLFGENDDGLKFDINLQTNMLSIYYETEKWHGEFDFQPRDTEYIEFRNYPKDDRSLYILRLLASHLKNFTDEQKLRVIDTLREILAIRPLRQSRVPDSD